MTQGSLHSDLKGLVRVNIDRIATKDTKKLRIERIESIGINMFTILRAREALILRFYVILHYPHLFACPSMISLAILTPPSDLLAIKHQHPGHHRQQRRHTSQQAASSRISQLS